MSEEYRQADPYCVQIELTEGCNLRCSFCGLNSIRGKGKDNDFKFMSLETAERIAQGMKEAGWNSRLEFAMHGEPSKNPQVCEILAVFRKALPRAYMLMESNGGGIVARAPKKIMDLFDAGLSCLALDEYQGISLISKIKRQIAEALDSIDLDLVKSIHGIQLHSYPSSGPAGNPHQRSTKKRLVFVEPIDTATKGTHSTLSNHAGGGAPPNQNAQGKRCAKPFREISVRWDGSVAICCNDWRGTFVVGDVTNSSMDELWHHPRMYAARRKLYAGERDFGPCDGCDATSYRPGLLPDPRGKIEMGEPTHSDDLMLEEALAEGPLTKSVLRSWELPDDKADS